VGRSQWLSLCVASVSPQARQRPWSRLAIASFLFRRSFLSKHHLAAVQRHPYISTKVHAARHSLTASVCRSIGSTYAGLYCAAHPGALGAGTAQRTRRQRTAAIETLPRGPRCSSSNHLSVVQNLRPALNLCHYPSGHALRILSRRTLNPHLSQVERWQGTPASPLELCSLAGESTRRKTCLSVCGGPTAAIKRFAHKGFLRSDPALPKGYGWVITLMNKENSARILTAWSPLESHGFFSPWGSLRSLMARRYRTASRSRSRPTASLAAIRASMLKIRKSP
jgi:hypothetical protein